jgi:uncharacterized protein YyaL (SSP411 family)
MPLACLPGGGGRLSRPAGGTPPPLGPRRRSVLAAVGVALASMTPGCDKLRGSSSGARIDAAWHRHALLDGLLARWVAVAPSETGAMRSAVDRRWVAAAEQPGDLTEHARLVYAFAIGYELSQDKRYLDAADRGAEFLLAHFHDPLHGGFFTRVAADGRVIHPSKSAYGHAFALFALSHMARVTQQERYRSAALRTWQVIHTWLRNPSGGFFGDLPRDFAKPAQPQGGSQNPVMHMFEALLALHDATQDPAALDGAKGVAEFVVYKLLVGLPDGGFKAAARCEPVVLRASSRGAPAPRRPAGSAGRCGSSPAPLDTTANRSSAIACVASRVAMWVNSVAASGTASPWPKDAGAERRHRPRRVAEAGQQAEGAQAVQAASKVSLPTES